MKCGVIVFPGSNCDDDLVYVLKAIMGMEVIKLWHKNTDLQGCEILFIPGGFSYGDYLRSGAIARFSPIMHEVYQHAQKGGYLIGICNGFQVLTESGLLPGALVRNQFQRFICKNAFIKAVTNANPMTSNLDINRVYKIPVAHAEGRYYADQETLQELKANDQVMFVYCDTNGEVNDASNFNGSVENIAGITNKNKNVMGMMPHPERAADEVLGNIDGKLLLESLLSVTGARV